MILKTYGIENLVDWKAQINVGKARVSVHFSGGAMTRYGVTPAEYSTSNAMMQHIIEGSDYYKNGRIKLLRQMEVDEAPQPPKGGVNESDEDPQPPKGGVNESDEAPQPPEEGANEGDEDPQPPEEGANEGDEGSGVEEIEVSCLQDAQDYLKEHFGISTSKIRTKDKVKEAASENGIEFRWL